MVQLANTVWRDFVTDGVPASGNWKPQKKDARQWGAWIEGVVTAFTSNGGLIYTSLAAMNADLTPGANSSAWVVGDATVANNGIYRKIGATGTGSWSRVTDLPYSFIKASNVGAGTANAIVAMTAIPLPANDAATLIALNITTNNTGAATVAFNGGSPLTIKTNSGNDVAANYLVAGAVVAGYVSAGTFRLLSDVASAADRSAAETAATNAAASAAAAAASASSINLPSPVASTFLVRNGGNTAYDAKNFADVRDLLNTAPYVADRPSLRALDILKETTAIMTGDRQGVWVFQDDDLATESLADTSENTYVRPASSQANIFPSTWDIVTALPGVVGVAKANNVVAGPYASRQAASIKEDASNGQHVAYATFSFTTGVTYTLSTYVKQGVGSRNIQMSLGNAFPATAQVATFNPSTGAVVAAGAGLTTAVTLINGFYRVSITATANATISASPSISMASGTAASYAGDNTSLFYVTGLKLETAAAPSTLGAWKFNSARFVGQFPTPALRTVEQKLWDRADLRDWNGLDLTDTNDNATLFQAAVNAMGGTGSKLYVPAGKIVLGSTVNIPDACHVEGPAKEGGYFNAKSAFFHFGHTGVGFKINTNLGSRSLKNLNTYRTQPTPGAGAYTPTAHDYDLDIEGGQDIELENINFLNPTKAINIRGNQTTSAPCGRISMKGLRGQPLTEGIRMTHCTDVCYLDEIHFWPFWSANAQVVTYMRANLGALIMGRVDNPKIGRFFSWGAFRGLNIYQQGALGSLPIGTVGRLHASVFEADNCNVGLLISGTGVTADFGAFHCASDPASPAVSNESLVWLLGNNADIYIGALRGQYTNGALVAINGSGNLVTIDRSQSAAIDADANGPAEFAVDAGNKLRLLSQPTTSAATPYSSTGEIQVNGQLSATGTWDPASTANGASSSTTITVTGAAVGDMALASLSTVTAGNWHISAIVTSANTVTVSLENVTGATVDLASGTLKVSVFKR
ncbi:hypothetical protein [Mesorhizobium sp. GbtcB19]|uniref:phage head spike fiber domain-containing protein n=1 Tax=Mesorhizobium sp. GbtcB19 TaxID=2824764 RepID=UPI001C2F376F|nr:hypothetical protein [Mesorhizobium sp. GbtcB19]